MKSNSVLKSCLMVALVLSFAFSASAYHGCHRGGWHGGCRGPVVYCGPRVVVAPPPPVYYPPVVVGGYYAPAPYYGPRVVYRGGPRCYPRYERRYYRR